MILNVGNLKHTGKMTSLDIPEHRPAKQGFNSPRLHHFDFEALIAASGATFQRVSQRLGEVGKCLTMPSMPLGRREFNAQVHGQVPSLIGLKTRAAVTGRAISRPWGG
jgi:hypothetical protein